MGGEVRGKGLQRIAVPNGGRHDPHAQRIALDVDHQHALPAIDRKAIDPVRAVEPTYMVDR